MISSAGVSLNCSDGAVRLSRGSTSYEGWVEMCLYGRWGSVCDDMWDHMDATVVCNHLGYNNTGANITHMVHTLVQVMQDTSGLLDFIIK